MFRKVNVNMNEYQIKLECLNIARNTDAVKCPKQVVEAARLYVDFIFNTGDSKIIEAARKLVNEVKNA